MLSSHASPAVIGGQSHRPSSRLQMPRASQPAGHAFSGGGEASSGGASAGGGGGGGEASGVRITRGGTVDAAAVIGSNSTAPSTPRPKGAASTAVGGARCDVVKALCSPRALLEMMRRTTPTKTATRRMREAPNISCDVGFYFFQRKDHRREWARDASLDSRNVGTSEPVAAESAVAA